LFKIKLDGSGFTTIHSFIGSGLPLINIDGGSPGELVLSGNTLYGTGGDGGSWNWGTVFSLNSDGTGFTPFYDFTGGSDGAFPNSGMILSSGILYGAANAGGNLGSGTIFSLSLPANQPQLTIFPSGPNLILTWPTNATGLVLQSAMNLASPVWTPASSALVVNGLNTVTNPISGTQQFFRLSQ